MSFLKKGFYIAPFPGKVDIPEYLAGLKDTIVYIPSEDNVKMPSLEELAGGRSINSKNKGITLIPPGAELIMELKKELRIEIAKLTEPDDLYKAISRITIEDLKLAEDIEMKFQTDKLLVKIKQSVFRDLYLSKDISKSVHSIGCPLISMISCAIAMNTGRIVTINAAEMSQDGNLMQVSLSYC